MNLHPQPATQRFAYVSGTMLIILGVLNLTVEVLSLAAWHAALHLAAGAVGLLLARHRHRGYTLSVSLGAIALSLYGFASIEGLGDQLSLPSIFSYLHAVLGLTGLVVFFGTKTPAPAAMEPRTE